MSKVVSWIAVLSFIYAVSSITSDGQGLPPVGGARLRLTKGVSPDYPSGAVHDSVEGRVLINFFIDETGRPTRVGIQHSTDSIFNEPSLLAVQQFVFTAGAGMIGPVMIGLHFTPELVTWETAPVLVWSVKPSYPDLARKAGLEGCVVLKIWVDKQGLPRSVETLRSDAEVFEEPAITAGMQFRFMPGYKNGNPFDVYTSVPLWFHFRTESED